LEDVVWPLLLLFCSITMVAMSAPTDHDDQFGPDLAAPLRAGSHGSRRHVPMPDNAARGSTASLETLKGFALLAALSVGALLFAPGGSAAEDLRPRTPRAGHFDEVPASPRVAEWDSYDELPLGEDAPIAYAPPTPTDVPAVGTLSTDAPVAAAPSPAAAAPEPAVAVGAAEKEASAAVPSGGFDVLRRLAAIASFG
jgi:hypothetical protein